MRLVPNQPLRRLQWRLTGLFVLATILTSVLLQVLLLVLVLYVTTQKKESITEVEAQFRSKAPQVESFFSGQTPNIFGLMKFLQREDYEDEMQPQGLVFHSLTLTSGPSFIAIADATGTIIASSPNDTTFPTGQPLNKFLTASERRHLKFAYQDQIKAAWDGPKLIATGPIHRQGKIVGIAFARTGPQEPTKETWISFLSIMTSSIFFNGIGSGIVGGLFGLLIARSVTRRLMAISTAADHWSVGDFQAVAPEKPTDELGLLAQQLNRMASELQQMIDLRNEIAVLEERQRITRDLHDTVKQEAFATTMMVASAQQSLKQGDIAGTQRALDEAGTLSRLMQTDLSGILKQLQIDRSSNLTQRMTELAEAWQRRSGIEIQIADFADLSNISLTVVNQIVAIAEEAVANAIKHSQGTHVTIALKEYSGLCELNVCDNGIGMPTDPPHQGMGLGTMKERAALIPQGHWEVSEHESGGTCIRLRFAGGKTDDE